MNIPATTRMDPKAILAVTFSWRKAKLSNVENRGVVEEMGRAWDSGIRVKLKVRKNHPKAKATNPPASSRTAFSKPTLKEPSFPMLASREESRRTKQP